MEDTLFIGDFPIEPPISNGFPIAMFDETGGYHLKKCLGPERQAPNRVLESDWSCKAQNKTTIIQLGSI